MKKIIFIILLLLSVSITKAQVNRVITTGVPFLLVGADARSAGMADQGVATTSDAYSQQYNPAKYAFAEDKMGFSVSYTPYLTNLVNDISLGQVTFFQKINEKSAWASSLRYFSLGDIELRTDFDSQPVVVRPSELALDGSYSLKLSEKFSMSVGGRFIRSSLRIPDTAGDATAASTFAVDVSGYYQSDEIAYENFNGRWRGGFNIQNLGPKINYDSSQFNANFLPTNLKLGSGFDFGFDEYSKLSLNVELGKLLVPTPQNPDLNGDGNITAAERTQNNSDYNKIGWTTGVLKSFGDAPDGFSEEMKEITYSIGSEYLYQESFALRAGYFNENKLKGARKFFTIGAGFKYNVVKLDVSYLFSASNVKNPLENTLRFSLTFNFGEKFENN